MNYFPSDYLGEWDPKIEEIARFVVVNDQGSTSAIQRNFELGYNRAGRVTDQLEKLGIVGSANGSKPREVLIKNLADLELILKNKTPILTPEEQELREEKRKQLAELQEKQRLQAEKDEIAFKLKEKYRKRQLEKLVLQELIDSGELYGEAKRPPIPREVADAVYARDGGRCVFCEATNNLQFDHIIPFSKGGATSIENLQLLCQKCNSEKSNKIG